jgi:protein PhnA
LAAAAEQAGEEPGLSVLDANGNLLKDSDTVTVIHGLEGQGRLRIPLVVTKVENIGLVEDDHNSDCNIEGCGP